MDDAPILVCYDDSNGARHAINAAAALFADRRAVVLEVAPPRTVAESYVALDPMTLDFESSIARTHYRAPNSDPRSPASRV